MSLSQEDQHIEAPPNKIQVAEAPSNQNNDVTSHSGSEDVHLFADRQFTSMSLTPEQAFAHMVKAMLGTGLLSLPYAFKHSGLYLGLLLLLLICAVCLYCMRRIVFAAHHICHRKNRDLIDYANIMRGAIEDGPPWISSRGYFFKQLVNVTMFIAQLGFCCVYFVFMADNLKDFFDKNYQIYIAKSVWMLLLLIPIMSICAIRRLKILAPFAFAANIIYLGAVAIVLYYFFTNLQPSSQLTKFGKLSDLPLFFGTVMFAFEGVCIVMPIENRMIQPKLFITWNGVLNSSCLTVLTIFAITGFYGYLTFGDDINETVTLNLPQIPFYSALKVMFVLCVVVSYPIQLFVPMERVEKFITRKCRYENQTRNIYMARFFMVLFTCMIAEIVPHLALFISLVGAVSCTALALLFPPIIDLLVCYSQNKLTWKVWTINCIILVFAFIGFTTGTYSALHDIAKTYLVGV